MILSIAAPLAHSRGKGTTNSVINITPIIQEIQLVDGQLVASGTATATIRGKTVTAPFENVPVNLDLADGQTDALTCPILDLELGPINLNLLGLIVETSPIFLQIDAHESEGLLGDLLCEVSNLLADGITLEDIINNDDILVGDDVLALAVADGGELLEGLTDLLNEALDRLLGSELVAIAPQRGRTCAILNLELGPLDLTLLGLQVRLDDCDDGPVTVDITAQRGALLGNLLCPLLARGQIPLGINLGDLLDLLPGQVAP